MYEQVFNLTSRPFTSIHYVKHYFPADAIDQSLQQTKMLVERGSGPVVVVGDHGTGKTLLLAILEENFKSQFRIVNISAALLRTREDLLQNILFQLQLNCRGLGENEMRLDLVEMLKDEKQRSILLLVDDAQKLTVDSVEEMQLLGDFIMDGQPRVRMVLAGSQGVEERLADTRLASFSQRIAGRFFLSSLNRSEVEQYVRAHVERAAGQPDELFSADSYRAIHEVCEGRPRYINQVCDHAMIFAATRGTVPITDSLVREAWYDIQKLPGAIAPTGSGAAMSESTASVPTVETDSEGWTVLEFGDLSESDTESLESSSESVEAAETTEEVTSEEVFADATPVVVEVTEDAAEEEAIEQPVAEQESSEVAEDETSIVDAPTAFGGAAILASAMAGFGIVSEDGPEQTTEPEEVAYETLESEAPTLIDSPTELAFSPAIESFGSFTAEQPQPEGVAEDAQEDAPEEVDQPETSSTATVFEDPFAADDYENEEVLVDAYSPFVAQQNQRSLDVTSEQLQNLTPGQTVQWSESPEPESTPDEEETFPTFETAMAPPEPVRETQTPERDPRDVIDTRMDDSTLGPSSLNDDFEVNREAGLLSAPQSSSEEEVTSINIDPVEANPGSGFVPLDPDAVLILDAAEDTQAVEETQSDQVSEEVEQDSTTAAEESFVQQTAEEVAVETETSETSKPETLVAEDSAAEDYSAEEPVAEEFVAEEFVAEEPVAEGFVAEEPVVAEDSATEEPVAEEFVTEPIAEAEPAPSAELNREFHEQAPRPNDPEIRRQAEEIIRSLGALGATQTQVSHETPTGPLSIQDETNAIEASIQRSIETQPTPMSESAAVAPSQVVMPNLDEIKNALRQAQERRSVPEVSAGFTGTGQIPVQIAGVDPVETEQEILDEVREQVAFATETITPQEPSTDQPLAGQDDRAILEVSQIQSGAEEAAAETQETPLPAWSQQEPSQGEAARVDYQRLFDQLRNVQGNQE